MTWQQCLHQFRKFNDLVISDSHGPLNGRVRTMFFKAIDPPLDLGPNSKTPLSLFRDIFQS